MRQYREAWRRQRRRGSRSKAMPGLFRRPTNVPSWRRERCACARLWTLRGKRAPGGPSTTVCATVETVLRVVLLPYLAELGDRWSTGEATVAQEHFASNLIRGRLLGIGRGWDGGDRPRAVLACAPGELHDLGLIAFGLTRTEKAGGSPISEPTPGRQPRRRCRPASLTSSSSRRLRSGG